MKSRQIGKEKLNSNLAKIYLKTLEEHKKFEIGEQVYVIIKDIKDQEFIFVESDIGVGIIPRNQLVDEDNNLIVNVGETIAAFYIGAKNGDHYFTTVPIGEYSKIILENAKINKIPLKGKVETILESGYHVRIGEELTFCPKSKMSKEVRKGMILPFVVIDYSKNSYIVSHNDYLQIQKEQHRKELIQKLKIDSIVMGKVKTFVKMGVLIDLGFDIQAFIPLSELSYKRVEHPNEILKIGEEICAKVIEIDWKEDKIILSLKELEKNPWLGPLPFNKGEILDVKIIQVKKNNIIVALPERFTGIIPVKETNIPKQKQLYKEFQKDQIIKAMIIDIDKENQKIILSIKSANEFFEQLEYKKYIETSQNDDSVYLGSILFKNE